MSGSGYFIEPLDVLFFRDSRPFAAGESFHARTATLPMPSVLYGALRTRLLEQRGFPFNSLEKAADIEATIEAVIGPVHHKGPFLARRNDSGQYEPLLPTPLDVVRLKTERAGQAERVLRLEPCQAQSAAWSAPLEGMWPLMPPREVDQVEAAKPLLTPDGAQAWMRGDTPASDDFCCIDELVKREHRFGLGMNEQTGTQDGERFFAAEFLRFTDGAGLAGELTSREELIGRDDESPAGGSPDRQVLAFGGERRSGTLHPAVFPAELTNVPETVGRHLKLWLVTPGLFTHGWLPGDGERDSPLRTIHGVRLRLVAAAVGKPVPVSGWDLAHGRPKPMRRAVPAGSVYCFELLDGPQPESAVKSLHWQAISDKETDRRAGFGVAVVGQWRDIKDEGEDQR